MTKLKYIIIAYDETHEARALSSGDPSEVDAIHLTHFSSGLNSRVELREPCPLKHAFTLVDKAVHNMRHKGMSPAQAASEVSLLAHTLRRM
jgi:hypothetical protein